MCIYRLSEAWGDHLLAYRLRLAHKDILPNHHNCDLISIKAEYLTLLSLNVSLMCHALNLYCIQI